MDGKPVTPVEQAFARTEVAGLDDVSNAGRGDMQDRRGSPGHNAFHHSAAPSLTGERLDPDGQRWLKNLPVTVRPVITAKRHPHIVNKFSRIWGRSELVAGYLDELLISNRPGRRGFAMEVLEELSLLQSLVHERRLS